MSQKAKRTTAEEKNVKDERIDLATSTTDRPGRDGRIPTEGRVGGSHLGGHGRKPETH